MVRTIIFKFPAAGEVETDRSETQLKGGHDSDNVVPFPRDWIGPTEDLVPIGSPPSDQLDDEQELGRALAADAFWGEGAASLHEAIEAPAEPVREAPGSPGVSRDTGPLRPQVVSAGEAVRSFSGLRVGVTHRTSVMAAVGVLVACCLALAVSLAAFGSTHGAAKLASTLKPRGQATPAGRSAPSGQVRLSRLAVERAIQRISGRSTSRRHRPAHHRVIPHTRSGTTSHPSPYVAVSYVPTGSSSPSEPTANSSTVSPSESTGDPASAGVSNPPSPSSSSSSKSSSSSASGPVGAGAPFGPGQVSSTSG